MTKYYAMIRMDVIVEFEDDGVTDLKSLAADEGMNLVPIDVLYSMEVIGEPTVTASELG